MRNISLRSCDVKIFLFTLKLQYTNEKETEKTKGLGQILAEPFFTHSPAKFYGCLVTEK